MTGIETTAITVIVSSLLSFFIGWITLRQARKANKQEHERETKKLDMTREEWVAEKADRLLRNLAAEGERLRHELEEQRKVLERIEAARNQTVNRMDQIIKLVGELRIDLHKLSLDEIAERLDHIISILAE